MRGLALFFLALSLSITHAYARGRKASLQSPSSAQSNYMNGLLKKCDNGEGQSCYDYALSLQGLNDPNDHRRITTFLRRACTLAYLPACKQHGKPVRARFVNENKVESNESNVACGAATLKTSSLAAINLSGGRFGQQITRIGKNSMFERAGLRVGDVVTKVNGASFTHGDQMRKALDGGGAMVEVMRGPAMIPLALSCSR